MNIDLPVEIENEAGLFYVTCEPHLGGDRKITRNHRANKFVPGGRRSRAGRK